MNFTNGLNISLTFVKFVFFVAIEFIFIGSKITAFITPFRRVAL